MTGLDFVHRKVVPSTQIQCSTTASLRASAIRARFRPRRLATSSAQRFKLENRVVRVSITLAASYSAVRIDSSPVRVIPPLTSLSPDWYFLGTSPNNAPTVFDLAIRSGLSIADLNVMATNGPTPGMVINRRQISSSRTIRSISRCNWSNSRPKRSSRLQHRPRDPLQHRLADGKFSYARLKSLARHDAHLQSKSPQDAPHARPEIHKLRKKLLARNKQRSHLSRADRLGVYRPEPAHAHKLGYPARVVAIRFCRHRRERRLNVSRLQKNRLKASLGQAGLQPMRQRTRFKADPRNREAK